MATRYDVITVGGGLGGAALAKCLAERGYRVLVLERETRFKDRVRGELMHPWGVTEAKVLGIYDTLASTCGHQTRWWIIYQDAKATRERDLAQTTPHRVGAFNFHHPEMQEVVLRMAADAGAEIRRGAIVAGVAMGSPATVSVQQDGRHKELQARLVVGADGRASLVRGWGRFGVTRDSDALTIAGALIEAPVPEDGVHIVGGPNGRVLFVPLGRRRVRAYFMSRKSAGATPLSGKTQLTAFLSVCRATGPPAGWFENAAVIGPLAQFNAADHWVEHPARNGVALIGDAAATSDPCFGCGLSLTLVGVRQLRDCLLASEDWEAAIDDYARQHDRAYQVVHRVTGWLTELLYGDGPAADERRARAFARMAAEPQRAPDIVGLGPASPSDESARRLLLGEE